MERPGDWIQTYTGRKFWVLDPQPDDIDIRDIAHSLSMQCRFGGHSRTFYSVASHSCNVQYYLDQSEKYDWEVRLWGLLHDAAEAYLVDVPRPIKNLPEFSQYKVVEKKLMEVICTKFGLPLEEPPAVKYADMVLLATEAREFMYVDWKDWNLPYPPCDYMKVKGESPKKAEKRFLSLFLWELAQKRV